MKPGNRTILKNASVLMGTQLLTWGLAVLSILFIPRYLGASGSGQLHLAISLWAIIGVVASFGMDALVTKEVARNPHRTGELLSTSAILRSIFFVIGTGLIILYARLAQYSEVTLWIIGIIGISTFFGSITASFQASLQGLERMEFTSLSQIVERTLVTFVSIGLLLLGFGVIQVAIITVLGSLVGLIIQFTALKRLQNLKPVISFSLMKWVLKSSLPFLFIGAFIVIYGQIDSILISFFVDERGVGLYSVTDRLIGTLFFIPTIIITSTGPALCRLFIDEPDAFTQLLKKSFDLTILIAVPVGLGLFLIANPLVVLLFGPDFKDSGPILAIRGIVLIFAYLNTLFGLFMIATDRQKAWTIVMAAAVLATLPLDIILIPWSQRVFSNGALGGAFAYIFTEIGILIAGLFLLKKGSLSSGNLWYAVRVLLAGIFMVVVSWWSRDLFIAIPIMIGSVSYALFLVLLRVLKQEDWLLFLRLFRNGIQRLRGRATQLANLH